MLNNEEDDRFLDLAIKLDRTTASEVPNKTGSKVFIAIGALYGEEHTFMHDLESFFWIFFWPSVYWNGPTKEMVKTSHEIGTTT